MQVHRIVEGKREILSQYNYDVVDMYTDVCMRSRDRVIGVSVGLCVWTK